MSTSISPSIEQIQSNTKHQHWQDELAEAQKTKNAGQTAATVAKIAGIVIGAVVGTFVCPGLGTVDGAKIGKKIGGLGGSLAKMGCDQASATKVNHAQNLYGQASAHDQSPGSRVAKDGQEVTHAWMSLQSTLTDSQTLSTTAETMLLAVAA